MLKPLLSFILVVIGIALFGFFLLFASGCDDDDKKDCPTVKGFCPAKYLKAYPDVAKQHAFLKCPALHYVASGKKEGRNPCPQIDKPAQTKRVNGNFRGIHSDDRPRKTVCRWSKKGTEYPNGLKVCWQEGKNLKVRCKVIDKTSRVTKSYGREGVHWNPRSDHDGKLVAMFPYPSLAAAKKRGMKKGKVSDFCYLEWRIK